MYCDQCNKPIDQISKTIVEWLSSDDWALAMYIRLVHPGCCYYEKSKELLESMDACDHWLPLEDLETFLDLAFEMPWDKEPLAKSEFLRYINQRNQHQRGTK